MPASVMIVTRNRRAFLEFTLAKLKRQLRPGDQLVLVDDASDESVADVVSPIESVCDTAFIRHESNVGRDPSKNEAILACAHECVVELDDDAWLVEEDALDACEAMIQDHPRVGAFALPIHYHCAARPDECGRGAKRWRGAHLSPDYAFMGCGAVFRRSAVIEAGLYPDYYGYALGETALCVRLFRIGFETRMFRAIRVIHGHEKLSDAEVYGATRVRDSSVASAANELCLAQESLSWPFSDIVALLALLRARCRGLSVKDVLQDFSCKRGHLRQDLRLSFRQTLSWLLLAWQVRRALR